MPRPKPFGRLIAALVAIFIVLAAGCEGGAFSIGPLSFDSVPHKGTLLYADRGVTVTRGGKGVVRYEPGMEVLRGDSIETADGQAVLDYEDGSTVMLNRRTRVQLGSIKLFFGELFTRVKSIAARGGGLVITDELSASVRGTEYGVRRALPGGENAPGHVQVYVRDGRVLCAPGARATWTPLTVTANQAFEVAGDRAAPAAHPVDAQALSGWADEAERRLRQERPPENRTSSNIPPGLSILPDSPVPLISEPGRSTQPKPSIDTPMPGNTD